MPTVAAALIGSVTLFQARTASKAALTVPWASLGLGAASKLVPALATLLLALLTGRKKGARAVAWRSGVFLYALAAFFRPSLLRGGRGLSESFAYHADRGLQPEPLLASVLMKLGFLKGVSFDHGAFNVRGRGVVPLRPTSLVVTAFLLAITAVLTRPEHRAARLGAAEFSRPTALFVLAILRGSKVLPPQYAIRFLSPVPLGAEPSLGAILSLSSESGSVQRVTAENEEPS
ncbi:MAG: hypothetical protein M3305_07840 [Actinomycetota bacterium]|nr:hypothetical protein [Actinomycetota bacterium]